MFKKILDFFNLKKLVTMEDKLKWGTKVIIPLVILFAIINGVFGRIVPDTLILVLIYAWIASMWFYGVYALFAKKK